MKFSFKIPSTAYSNFYEIARYNLTWRIAIFALVSLIFFNISLLVTVGPNFILPSSLAILVTAVGLLLLYKLKKYEPTAYLFCILGTILTNYSLYAFTEISHLIDVVWIIILLIYSYFALGKKVGLIILLADFLSVGIYIFFFLNENIKELAPLQLIDKIPLLISSAVCFSLLSYILFLFVQTSKIAENKYLVLTSELRANNDEKSVLIKEIHHRVKNNLQVIISLLRLQSNEIEIENQKKPFNNTVNRVVAMALIHEKIYQTPDLAHINLGEYVEALGKELIDSLAINSLVDFEVKSNVSSIKPKSLIPLALIFNELISNSLKHGINTAKAGKISIQIFNEESNLKIIYKDSGVWIPSDNKDSLGISLIHSLTEQLSGTVEKTTKEGTQYNFNFVYDKYI